MKRFYTTFILLLITIFSAKSQYWKEFENIPAPFRTNYWLDVYFHPSNPDYGWVCGFSGMVIRTTNAGDSWSGSIVNGANHLEHVHFPTLTIGYTSGPAGIFKSTDGGVSWSNITPETIADYWGCYFVNENVGLVIGGGCIGQQRFYRTENGGQTWTLFTASEPNSGLTDLLLFEPNGLGYAVSSGNLWRTTDGGRTWAIFTSTGSNVWHEEITNSGSSFLLPYAGTNCSGQGGDGGMRFTTDMGNSWNVYQTGFAMFGTYLLDAQNGWACGDGRSVLKTTNGGLSWQTRNCGIRQDGNLDDIWFVHPNLGYVVGSGVYKLSPPEYDFTKDSLFFKDLCLGDSKSDSLLIKHLSFIEAYSEFEIIDDSDGNFELITPQQFFYLPGCSDTRISVRYTPKNQNDHLARLKITVHPGTSQEVIKYIYLVGKVSKVTAFPQNDLIIENRVVCNTMNIIALPWFLEGDGESILDIRQIEGTNFIRNMSPIPYPLTKPVTNSEFAIQLPDTGWFETKFRVTLDPCYKDTVITIRAYGVSPIISHSGKTDFTSECLETIIDTIKIHNTGNDILNIDGARLEPTLSGFSIVGWINQNSYPVKIQRNEFAEILISYSPEKYGNENCQIILVNNDSTKVNGNKNPYIINLTGNSNGVELIDSLFIDFGDICLGLTKLQTVRLKNSGNLDAILSIRDIPGEMIVSIEDINRRIRGNDSVSIRVSYNALKKGEFREVIAIRAEPCDEITYLIINGRVVSNELDIIPEVITGIVKTGEILTETVRINSLSDINLNVKSIRVEPEPQGWSYNFSPGVPMVLLPEQGADFTFNFTPLSASKLEGRIVIETDGLCLETFYVDLDLSSFSRLVDVNPKAADFGLTLCEKSEKYFDITISNRGFSPDTISSISFSPDINEFSILNLPELPLILQPEEDFIIRLRFLPQNEGIFLTNLNIVTIGDDGQSFSVLLTGEFRMSDIAPKIHNVDFRNLELCSEKQQITVKYINSGSIADTIIFSDYQGHTAFSIIGEKWTIESGGEAEISLEVSPDLFSEVGNYSGKFVLNSVVCPDNFEINVQAEIIKPELIIIPTTIDFGSKWEEQKPVLKVEIHNVGQTDLKIDDISLSNEIDFILIGSPLGQMISSGKHIEFDIQFIAGNFGDYSGEILVKYSSLCVDSVSADISGSVFEEKYENLVFINEYEAVAGEQIEISVNLKEGIERINAEQIDIQISFDKYLFYPNAMSVRQNNLYSPIEFDYLSGVLKVSVSGNQSKDLLKSNGEIFKILGTVMASIPDNTQLKIDVFDIATDKDIMIDTQNGKLQLTDYCAETVALSKFIMMPWFRIKSGDLANDGIYKFQMNSTGDVDVEYSVIDISGIISESGIIRPGREYSEVIINLRNLSSGNYFILLKSKYQNEMLNIINIK
ncbi:MAG: hypothetical protein KIT33_01685 [Candidatus Kapabacteria bacterium]|nr:hypothetical protein [Ignavibacteriota bacterium]MCW5883662.1 hypothetical protein [Candidatus Kapabacteria bacterium]